MHRQEMVEALPQLAFRHRGEVGAASPQLDRHRAMVGQAGEIVQAGLSEHPHEGLADLRRQVRSPVARLLLVVGDPRLDTEELLVHRPPRQAWRPLAEQPDQGGVEVAVAAEHTELAELVGRELVEIERTHPAPGVAPTELGQPEGGVAGQRRHRIGEHLADVGPRVDGEACRQRRVGDEVHRSPPSVDARSKASTNNVNNSAGVRGASAPGGGFERQRSERTGHSCAERLRSRITSIDVSTTSSVAVKIVTEAMCDHRRGHCGP